MYIIPLAVAGVALLPVLARIWLPYLWMDLRYTADLVWVLLKIAHRRRTKPRYLVVDRLGELAGQHPRKPFVVFEGHTFSYQDAEAVSNRVARALLQHAGLRRGDTAAIYMGNEPAFIWSWLALGKLGHPVALLNYNIRNRSLLHCFSCCGAKVLIAAADLADAVREVLPSLLELNVRVFIMARECSTPGMHTLLDKIEEASDEAIPPSFREQVTRKSPAVYIYTSGTTGLPKAAVMSQDCLLAAMEVLTSNGVTPKDIIYLNLPLYHATGFVLGFIGSLGRGTTVILRRKFSASQFWDDCRKHKVTVVQYIGEVMRYLCNTPKRDNDRDHSVRLAIGNGLRSDVWKEFLSRFGNVELREFYAATEGNISFVNYTGKIGSVGRVNFLHRKLFPYALIKYDTERDEPVRDSTGLCVEVPKGETGLLVCRITKIAPFVGYAKNSNQTESKRLRDVFQKGDLYFNSGDLLKIDQDNFIYFQDRIGDTFRWKGENVATTEVSDVLTMLDFIQEANVYGVTIKGQEGRIGMAAITLKEGKAFGCSSMYNHVVSYLPSYARPHFIRIQNSLEVTGTFKQMKLKLVEEGFNPAEVHDPMYFLDVQKKSYIPMTLEINHLILSGAIKV